MKKTKKIEWEGSSLQDLYDFPKPARRRAGYELFQIQNGEEPTDWKPMRSIGLGVREIRIHIDNEYRVIYLAKLKNAIYILHAFKKKTAKTSKKDLKIAAERYHRIALNGRKP